MSRRRLAAVALAAGLAAGWVVVPPPARGAEYELVTSATYAVDPRAGEIGVTVEIEFTNTTPNPDGRFSVFDELRLAVHDQARNVSASDDDGRLAVDVARRRGVNVAAVELREGLRYRDSVRLELRYVLPDTDDPQMRVRRSVVVFPAWGFGTRSQVRVTIPDGYEVRVDGDTLTEDGGAYVSGEIGDPSRWLALVTALRPVDYATLNSTVPLAGGTADLSIRAFADDEAWGERIRDLVMEALPRLEEDIGLPYPLIGQLVITEAVPADATGFGEGAGGGGTELLVAYDQPDFTALHQVAHVWLTPAFADARWIREGLASLAAGRVGEQLGVEPPFDPARVAEARAAAAFPLDEWPADASPDGEAFGYAASWDVMQQLEERVGADALRTVLRRVAAGIGPYEAASIEPQPTVEGVSAPVAPLDSRNFLDHLEAVSGADLSEIFAERVLGAEDAALLEPRAAARAEFEALVDASGSWGAPDPVRGAMSTWAFEEARSQIQEARAWLDERDAFLARMEAVGLSPSDRLQQAFRAYGGGADADQELEAHRAVVELYADAADELTVERSLVERIGLIGGAQPEAQLAEANGRFASGDLRGAVDAVTEARRLLDAADTSGIVRLASAALVIVVLLAVALMLFRRRAAYTQRP